MARKYFWKMIVWVVFFALMFPCCVHARVSMDAPATVGRGNAFAALASSSVPLEKLVFLWRGQTIPATAREEGGAWVARVLLPVPLDEKSAMLTLGVEGVNGDSFQKRINIHDVARPVQKLQVDKKYVDPPRDVLERIKSDRAKVRGALSQYLAGRHWDLPFTRPVPGTVSSQFGLKRVFNGKPRGEHRGLDLRGAQGTPIHAVADGVVALVDNLYYSGNTVYINHGEGVFSAYLHMSKTAVKPGQNVRRGQIVGEVGSTGRVTGPHLHLSVIAQGESVDPLPLLQQGHVKSEK